MAFFNEHVNLSNIKLVISSIFCKVCVRVMEIVQSSLYKVQRSQLYKVCQLAPQVLLPLACPLATFPLPVGHGDEGVAQQL